MIQQKVFSFCLQSQPLWVKLFLCHNFYLFSAFFHFYIFKSFFKAFITSNHYLSIKAGYLVDKTSLGYIIYINYIN